MEINTKKLLQRCWVSITTKLDRTEQDERLAEEVLDAICQEEPDYTIIFNNKQTQISNSNS